MLGEMILANEMAAEEFDFQLELQLKGTVQTFSGWGVHFAILLIGHQKKHHIGKSQPFLLDEIKLCAKIISQIWKQKVKGSPSGKIFWFSLTDWYINKQRADSNQKTGFAFSNAHEPKIALKITQQSSKESLILSNQNWMQKVKTELDHISTFHDTRRSIRCRVTVSYFPLLIWRYEQTLSLPRQIFAFHISFIPYRWKFERPMVCVL